MEFIPSSLRVSSFDFTLSLGWSYRQYVLPFFIKITCICITFFFIKFSYQLDFCWKLNSNYFCYFLRLLVPIFPQHVRRLSIETKWHIHLLFKQITPYTGFTAAIFDKLGRERLKFTILCLNLVNCFQIQH